MSAKLKRTACWIGIGISSLVALYFLTTPLILPRVIHQPVLRVVYSPVIHGIEDEWFGCEFFRWYCFDVCHMQLLMMFESPKPE
jgi:hypothetical protein